MSSTYRWAPNKPTAEMVRAGMGVGEDNCLYWKHPQVAYVDMLAVAPQPPALGGEPEVLGYRIERGTSNHFRDTPAHGRGTKCIALIDRAHLARYRPRLGG